MSKRSRSLHDKGCIELADRLRSYMFQGKPYYDKVEKFVEFKVRIDGVMVFGEIDVRARRNGKYNVYEYKKNHTYHGRSKAIEQNWKASHLENVVNTLYVTSTCIERIR